MAARIGTAPEPQLRFTFDDETIAAAPGDTVAAALMIAGRDRMRWTPVSGAPRGAFCMMGVCFECLAEIDGRPNCQACTVEVRDGMAVRSMQGEPEVP